jgi:hypothetical protein
LETGVVAVCLCGYVLPQNPQVSSSVAAFHFIVQSLFSIRGILYASFFGFIFLKGIAEVSSGVSIGG